MHACSQAFETKSSLAGQRSSLMGSSGGLSGLTGLPLFYSILNTCSVIIIMFSLLLCFHPALFGLTNISSHIISSHFIFSECSWFWSPDRRHPAQAVARVHVHRIRRRNDYLLYNLVSFLYFTFSVPLD